MFKLAGVSVSLLSTQWVQLLLDCRSESAWVVLKFIKLKFKWFFSKCRLASLYPRKRSLGVYRNHPVCLSVCLSVQSKLNLGYNFWIKRDKAFILLMWVPYDKTFPSVPNILSLWLWLLTYIWKNLTLAITFEPKEIGLSYYICGSLVTRPFFPYQKFWPCDLDLDFWPTFEKTQPLP